MAGDDKRKGADREKIKKPKPLIKLNGKSDINRLERQLNELAKQESE